MKIGTQIIVTHPDGEFEPSRGVIVGAGLSDDSRPIMKINHGDWDNWYPKSWVAPLLRLA